METNCPKQYYDYPRALNKGWSSANSNLLFFIFLVTGVRIEPAIRKGRGKHPDQGAELPEGSFRRSTVRCGFHNVVWWKLEKLGGSHGLPSGYGGDSCSEGCGFES